MHGSFPSQGGVVRRDTGRIAHYQIGLGNVGKPITVMKVTGSRSKRRSHAQPRDCLSQSWHALVYLGVHWPASLTPLPCQDPRVSAWFQQSVCESAYRCTRVPAPPASRYRGLGTRSDGRRSAGAPKLLVAAQVGDGHMVVSSLNVPVDQVQAQ